MLIFCSPVQGQEKLDNIRITVKRNEINIQYDIEATEPGLLFKITPYYVYDKDNRYRMNWVSGDVGANITAGKGKLIVWEFRRDLNENDGDMRIDLDWEIMPPKIAIPLAKEKYRRLGKVLLEIDSIRGERYEIIDLNRQVKFKGQLAKNQDEWKLRLPKSLPVQQKYQIRIWDTTGIPAYTSAFIVRRKIPRSLITGVGLIIAGALIIWDPPPPDPLPFPPSLPAKSE